MSMTPTPSNPLPKPTSSWAQIRPRRSTTATIRKPQRSPATARLILSCGPVRAGPPVQWTTGNGNWSQLAGSSAPTGLNNVNLTGGIVSVSGAQLANLTTISGGRLDLTAGSSLASDVTVNAGGSISGAGWLDANLTIAAAGKLALTSGNALNVYGTANIAGARLDIPSGFNPPLGQEFTAITAIGGLIGTLDTSQPLGSNLTLKNIRYTLQSVMVTIGIPGDFNNDGTVNAADYVALAHDRRHPHRLQRLAQQLRSLGERRWGWRHVKCLRCGA